MPAPIGAVTDTEPLKGIAHEVFSVGVLNVTVGGTIASFTVALDVFVQPLAEVTVTVNVPD